ncbi:peptidoglycan-binding protein [Kitasatospora sp. NBC_00240]|uniref:peptidoglycan-binding protein n=1 Tax=Kitasatospora sp. NBC_00240 TaxID=2903567 RepID=UPI00225372DF|nr:peptidoglycan-binding protein [Kitasatospora sp. NBC_00240]MCX5210065.1 peptidoglycan-binding protein [Kitasatospora sp. NBC_00240]
MLTSTVVTRGQVAAGRSVDVAPVGAGAGGGSLPVVTKLPLRAGEQVQEASSVLEVAGRPVFALLGELPVYRDLKPGTAGADVQQLQQALTAAGFPVGADAPGTFGEGTKAAVKGFYTARGYDPLPSSPDGAQRVAAAKDAVRGGERALADAKEALESVRKATDGAKSVPASESGTEGRPTPDKPAAATQSGLTAARKQVTRASEDLDGLQVKLAEVSAASGPMVPASELVFLPGFPARVDTVAGQVGSTVSGKVLTLSAGALVVHGRLSPSDRGLVQPGQKVEIVSELTGMKAAATVASVSDSIGGSPQAAEGEQGQNKGAGTAAAGTGAGYQLLVQPDAPLDSRLANQDVRLTIVAASSAGAVLTVPLSAISATVEGRTVITMYDGGQRRRVEVTPGTVGAGSAEVRPLVDGSVREGDQVIVGVKGAAGDAKAGAR